MLSTVQGVVYRPGRSMGARTATVAENSEDSQPTRPNQTLPDPTRSYQTLPDPLNFASNPPILIVSQNGACYEGLISNPLLLKI